MNSFKGLKNQVLIKKNEKVHTCHKCDEVFQQHENDTCLRCHTNFCKKCQRLDSRSNCESCHKICHVCSKDVIYSSKCGICNKITCDELICGISCISACQNCFTYYCLGCIKRCPSCKDEYCINCVKLFQDGICKSCFNDTNSDDDDID